MRDIRHVNNFNVASDEALCKAVFAGVYAIHTAPDQRGDEWHVTTDQLWEKYQCLGSGKTVAEAWANAYYRFAEEVWRRIGEGRYTRHITFGDEREEG